MSKTALSMDLPKVGDHLKRIMSATYDCLYPIYEPQDCVVTCVNESHHWYQVQFKESGAKECYGLPIIDHSIIRPGALKTPVFCFENGMAYSTIAQCAHDLGLDPSSVASCVNGRWNSCGGYHFAKVL